MFGNPYNFFGFDIIVEEPKIVPKLRLRDDTPVTDAFREEMNQWLLDMFGTRDESIVPMGTAYMFGNNMVIHPEMAVMLCNITA